jgi:hypothetical protein
MSVESGRREYDRVHAPRKARSAAELKGAKPGTVAHGELRYLAEHGDQDARDAVNVHQFEGGSVPVLPDNVGPNAA